MQPDIPDIRARQRSMAALARMDGPALAERYRLLAGEVPAAQPVRGPEVGLVMVRGRAGGGGAPFNLGEASVVRATVTLATGEVGHAVILGRDADKARMAAHLDALWQHGDWRERVERDFVAPALAAHADADRARAEETEATRVDFFTLVRGDNP
ncbi:phosphonate C-P lyase system protein PhnG [Aureimonas sp. AU12]|uniref:phosphonate C-P lyase system protein PhnG n=1 Tax=Aureimonas sp. AU12 TaxID=1638161 RepID=UPI00078246EC|nr:phosphonate C-P lyase system protein PhnG [Aureimonas sp. AU12]